VRTEKLYARDSAVRNRFLRDGGAEARPARGCLDPVQRGVRRDVDRGGRGGACLGTRARRRRKHPRRSWSESLQRLATSARWSDPGQEARGGG